MKIKKTAYTVQYTLTDGNKKYFYCDAELVPNAYNLLTYFRETTEIIDHYDTEQNKLVKLEIIAINPADTFKEAKTAARELNNYFISQKWLAPCYKY